jgi:hypothetical protein
MSNTSLAATIPFSCRAALIGGGETSTLAFQLRKQRFRISD